LALLGIGEIIDIEGGETAVNDREPARMRRDPRFVDTAKAIRPLLGMTIQTCYQAGLYLRPKKHAARGQS
jgi:hypothetical protein